MLEDLADKKVMVGCLDLSNMKIESPDIVVKRVKKALEVLSPENVILAPDCGMKYLPRDVAEGKLRSMVVAAAILREEYA